MSKWTNHDIIIESGKSANLEEIKLENIIYLGLGFTGMMRLLKKNQIFQLHRKLVDIIKKKFFTVTDAKSFEKAHSDFCEWGTKNIWLAANKKHKKPNRLIAYGQIAKTLNVVLKVVIHYSQLPDAQKANSIRPWLHAAIDNKMMHLLKSKYSYKLDPWPESIEKVCRDQYFHIQTFVQDFIVQNHANKPINPVDFDDIYWNLLNKKDPDIADGEGEKHGKKID